VKSAAPCKLYNQESDVDMTTSLTTRILECGLCLCLMTALLGCTTTGSEKARADAAIPVGYRYSPELSPGIETVEAAKKDLAELLAGGKTPGVKYYRERGVNSVAGQQALTELVSGKDGPISFWRCDGELVFMAFSSLAVLEDRIEVTPRIAFFFDELPDYSIVVEKTNEEPTLGYHLAGLGSERIVRPYKVAFPGNMAFVFDDLSAAQRFANDLFVIQQPLRKKQDERVAHLESRAAEYRALAVKPPVSEEQRKVIVQANVLNQQQDYAGAIALYLQAIDLDPVSYPGAYFNLGLLSAQMKRYNSAITYMKQYMLLVPEAPDARSAQDKIYEWELLGKK
jgi:tetratricopeptide (TPR) repeat protein